MNIDFQVKNYDLDEELKSYFLKKLQKLSIFLPHDAHLALDIIQNPAVQSGPELFRVALNITSPLGNFFSEENGNSVKGAFDKVHKEITRMIKNSRSKSNNLIRRAGVRIKGFFRK